MQDFKDHIAHILDQLLRSCNPAASLPEHRFNTANNTLGIRPRQVVAATFQDLWAFGHILCMVLVSTHTIYSELPLLSINSMCSGHRNLDSFETH